MSGQNTSIWRKRAQNLIAHLTRDLPVDATVIDRRKALRGKGYGAHLNTSWGRKMWGKEVRKYLARHGDTSTQALFFRWPDNVHFPFREEHPDA